MGKVTKIDDYRNTSRYGRAVKKQRRDRFMSQYKKFMGKAGVFFDLANSKRGEAMVKDFEDVD